MATFEFIGVKDCGATSCPHCGSEGRYIYEWIQDGKKMAAMAGCFKQLTGALAKSDIDRYFISLSEKQAKNKPLNGWDKTIIRMQEFKATGKYSAEWCDQKIMTALSERQGFLASKRR